MYKAKMKESHSLQKLYAERKLEEIWEPIQKLALGAQPLDKMLKTCETYSGLRGLGYLDDQEMPSLFSYLVCSWIKFYSVGPNVWLHFWWISANYSLSPYFDSYDFLSIATSKGETSFFDLNVLSYVEELLNWSLRITNEPLIIKIEVVMLLEEYKSSQFNNDSVLYLKWNVVHITLIAQSFHSWHFDNGCSRHMIGDKSFTSFV